MILHLQNYYPHFLSAIEKNSLCPVVSVNNLVTKWRLGAEALPSFSSPLLEVISVWPVGGGLGKKNSTTRQCFSDIAITKPSLFPLLLLLYEIYNAEIAKMKL